MATQLQQRIRDTSRGKRTRGQEVPQVHATGFRGRCQAWSQPCTAQLYLLGGRGVVVRLQWPTSVPFKLQLKVHNEQGKLDSEEQDISPQQLEKWIVLLHNEHTAKDVYKPPKLDADGFVIVTGKETVWARSTRKQQRNPRFAFSGECHIPINTFDHPFLRYNCFWI